jgi:hypothetical protein
MINLELRNKKQKIRNKEVERIDFRNSQPIELIERFEPLEPFFCFAQSTQGSKGAKERRFMGLRLIDVLHKNLFHPRLKPWAMKIPNILKM